MSLEVSIGADIRPFGKSIKDLESQLKRFQQRLNESTDPRNVQRLNNAIDATKARIGTIQEFGRSGSIAATKMKGDFTALSHVIQDLPYGFNAIGNNLTQLIPAAGGLGLAFSALVSGVTLAQVGFGAWTRGLTDNNDALDGVVKTGSDYANSLSALARASLVGSQSATQELVSLRALYNATQSNTLSLSEKRKAVDELQKQYPTTFANFRDEDILAGRAKAAYDKLTGSIIAYARAQAAKDIIAKNANRELENERKNIDLQTEKEKLLKDIVKIQNQIKAGGTGTGAAGYGIMAEQIETRINEIIKQQNNLKADTVLLNRENLRLEKEILKYQQKGGTVVPGGSGDGVKKDKSERLSQIDYTDSIKSSTLISQLRALNNRGLSSKGSVVGIQLPITPMIETGPLFSQGQIIKDYFDSDVLPQLSSGFNHFFNEALVNGELSFQTLGESIKDTFASVLADQTTKGLVSLLSNLGTKGGSSGVLNASTLAATGGMVGNIGSAGAATATSGGLAIPIIGGIAALGVIASLFKKRKTNVPTPSFSSIPMPSSNYTTPTASRYGSGSNTYDGGGRVVFEISGTNLVGILNRAGAQLTTYRIG